MKKKIMSIITICCMTIGITLCSFTQSKMVLSDEMDTEVTAQIEPEKPEEPETEEEECQQTVWRYHVNRVTNTVEIREYSGQEANVVIPETMEGKTVTAIYGNTFQTKSGNLKSITIPKSVIEIDQNTFRECGKVFCEIQVSPDNPVYASEKGILFNKEKTRLICCPQGKKGDIRDLPQSLEVIENSAFYSCKYLGSIEIPEKVVQIGSSAFQSCSRLKSIKIPEKIKCIQNDTFSGCKNLANIELPDCLESIEDNAFYECAMSYFELPQNLKAIGKTVFECCLNIESISISSDNPVFETEDGILYDKGKKKLIAYPSGKQEQVVELPVGLTCIGAGAFKECWNITAVKFPAGIDSIEEEAFAGCSSLSGIELPEGLKSIGNSAFYDCESLSAIYLPTEVRKIGKGAFNSCHALTDIHVSWKNQFYASEDGILYNKEKTILIACPNGKKGELSGFSESLLCIGEEAFYGCDKLTGIFLPESLKEIRRAALCKCNCLEKIYISENNKFFTSDDGVLYDKEKTELIAYPVSRQEISYSLPEGVESIRAFAFYQSNIQHICFTGRLKRIGDFAFYDCLNLEVIHFPSGLQEIGESAFEDCTSLSSIVLPEGIKRIGNFAFHNCDSCYCSYKENSVELPGGVEFIGKSPFPDCEIYYEEPQEPLYIEGGYDVHFVTKEGLLYNFLADDTVEISGCPYDFMTDYIVIPDEISGKTVISIGQYAFRGRWELKKVRFPEGLERIEEGAFESCGGIAQIELPENLKSLGEGAFHRCYNLESVKMPKYLKRIEKNTFYECNILKNVVFPTELKEIGDHAFSECIDLGNIILPEKLERIGKNAFSNCSKLTKAVFSGEIQSIGEQAFSRCENLIDIEFHGSVKQIEDGAFESCRNLVWIELPEGLERIGKNIFLSCENLRIIQLPESLAEIGNFAFCSCSNLQEVYYPKSKKAWKKVVAGIGNGDLQSAEIYYASARQVQEETRLAEISNSIATVSESIKDFIEQQKTLKTDWCYYIDRNTGTVEIREYTGEGKREVTVPETIEGRTVTTICERTFSLPIHNGLECVNLPKSITKIEEEAFYSYDSLKNIQVSSDNPVYASKDGILYNKEKTELISCPQGKSGKLTHLPASLKRIRNSAFISCENLSAIEIPESVEFIGKSAFRFCYELKSLNIPEGIRHIGDEAFEYCGMSEVKLPKSLKSMGGCVFGSCKNLKNIQISPENPVFESENGILYEKGKTTLVAYPVGRQEETVELPESLINIKAGAFYGGENFIEIKLPKGLRQIGEEAFSWCFNLRSVEMPDSVRYIGSSAFYYCENLDGIKIPESLESIEKETFFYCNLSEIEMPDGIEVIGERAFEGCKFLKKIRLPENLKIIGAFAFSDCAMDEIIIPEGVEKIGRGAFAGCSWLKKLRIPEGVRCIEQVTFWGCSSLISLELPASIELIEERIFQEDCTSLTDIQVSEDNPKYASENGILYNKDKTELLAYPLRKKELPKLPDSLKRIGSYAFADCENLTHIELPQGVESIGYWAFRCCEHLETVKLSENIERIGKDAFAFCSSLKQVYYPKDKTSWEKNVFVAKGNDELLLADMDFQ